MEKNNKILSKKSIILLIITIVTILGIVGLSAYAYFATTISNSANIAANVKTIGGSYSFTVKTSGDINMNVNLNDMLESKASSTAIKSDNANVVVNLQSPSNNETTICSYDIVWNWGDSSAIYSTKDSGAPEKEFTVSLLKNNQTVVSEMDLTNFLRNDKKVTLYHGTSISSSLVGIEDTYKIESKIYNINVNQPNIKGKNFTGKITVENVDCSIISDEYELVEYIESDGNAYIKTDYSGNDNYQIDCDMQITGNVNSNYWFGQSQAHGAMMFNGLYGNNSLEYNWLTIRHNESNRVIMNQTKINEETVRIEINNQVFEKSIGNNDGTGNFLIFACNNVRVYGSSMRLYSFRMHDGSRIIMNLIPCYRKSDKKPGLYDLVNNKFYENSGAGEFSYGNSLSVLSNNNFLANGGFESVSVVNSPSKTANSVTHTWDGNLNGIPGDPTHAYSASSWGTGSNMGVPVPEIGYHAHIIKFNNNMVVDYHTNESYNGKTDANVSDGVSVVPGSVTTLRWLGISQGITASKFVPGAQYRITMDVYSVTSGAYVQSGLYYKKNSNTTSSFYSGYGVFKPSKPGVWETISATFTLDSDYLTTSNPALYVYGHYVQGEVYVDNVILEKV